MDFLESIIDVYGSTQLKENGIVHGRDLVHGCSGKMQIYVETFFRRFTSSSLLFFTVRPEPGDCAVEDVVVGVGILERLLAVAA
jgi:hypothetical protein